MTRDDCAALDAADPLAFLRGQYALPDGVIYLDGNSLGALPRTTADRVSRVVRAEWGDGLIRSWNTAGWIDLSQRVGDKIARLVGAGPGEVVVADSTSINLYKVLWAAMHRAGPGRVVLSERGNFPTDLYLARSLCDQLGSQLDLVERDAIDARLAAGDVGVLLLTQVDYRSGALHHMAAVNRAAHAAGALVVWDLAHSAGALPVALLEDDADYAIGCGYKYLHGGPGAPAFVWVHPRHLDAAVQPLRGWLGHAAPFDFSPEYRPAAGITGFVCGTPPILSLAALECGVDSLLAAQPAGGMVALRAKSVALGELFIRLVDERCVGTDLTLRSPRDATTRGSQVSLGRAEGGYEIVQALIERGVIGDFRAATGGGLLRFGLTPTTLRYVDVWDAVSRLEEVVRSGHWRDARFRRRSTVT